MRKDLTLVETGENKDNYFLYVWVSVFIEMGTGTEIPHFYIKLYFNFSVSFFCK